MADAPIMPDPPDIGVAVKSPDSTHDETHVVTVTEHRKPPESSFGSFPTAVVLGCECGAEWQATWTPEMAEALTLDAA